MTGHSTVPMTLQQFEESHDRTGNLKNRPLHPHPLLNVLRHILGEAPQPRGHKDGGVDHPDDVTVDGL